MMRHIMIGIIFIALASTSVTTILVASAPQALAQDKKKSKPRTRRSEVLGKRAFRLIESSQNLMAEEKYEDAKTALQTIIDGERFKPYEKAVALQALGYVFAAQGDYTTTIATFERALALGSLPPRIVSDMTYNLAQLNLAEGRTKRAQNLLEKWLAESGAEPNADVMGLKAQIHLLLDEFAAAETAAEQAVSLSDPPKLKWLRVLVSALLRQDKFAQARPYLERGVVLYPSEKPFWQQLTAVYYKAGDEAQAFMAQKTMYLQGMLQSSSELSNLAQLYLYHNVPIKAAEVLERGLAAKKIEPNEKTYEMLANAYMYAREWNKSIKPLTLAAQKSKTGKFFVQLGQSYLQDEEWQKAESALVKGLDKGGLDDASDSWLLLGIARVRQNKFDPAISAFRKASEDDALATDAFRWIRSIERRLVEERRRKEQRAAQNRQTAS